MERVKRLLDPDGILNPGVVLNANPRCHLKDLKPCPTISPLADRCIECGLCEPRCPSRDLTLTPRQRIVVTRELVRLSASREAADAAWRDSLERDFAYDGVQTCAGDSMCQAACPVKIDTGALMKELKAASHSPAARAIAAVAATRFSSLARLTRVGLSTLGALRGHPLGARAMALVTQAAHALAPGVLPRLPSALALPRPAPRFSMPAPRAVPPRGTSSRGSVVYFPSCLTRMIGPLPGESGDAARRRAMRTCSSWAGFDVAYPDGVAGALLRHAVREQGLPPARRAPRPAARRRRCGRRRRAAAGCRW